MIVVVFILCQTKKARREPTTPTMKLIIEKFRVASTRDLEKSPINKSIMMAIEDMDMPEASKKVRKDLFASNKIISKTIAATRSIRNSLSPLPMSCGIGKMKMPEITEKRIIDKSLSLMRASSEKEKPIRKMYK
jgi:hypothetical protein